MQEKENPQTEVTTTEIPSPAEDRIYLVDGKLQFKHYPQKHVTMKYMKLELERLNRLEMLTESQEVLYALLSKRVTQGFSKKKN